MSSVLRLFGPQVYSGFACRGWKGNELSRRFSHRSVDVLADVHPLLGSWLTGISDGTRLALDFEPQNFPSGEYGLNSSLLSFQHDEGMRPSDLICVLAVYTPCVDINAVESTRYASFS